MKKLLLSYLFVPAVAIAAIDLHDPCKKRITMPSQKELQRRLQEAELDYFADNIQLSKDLEDKYLHPLGVHPLAVNMAVTVAIHELGRNLGYERDQIDATWMVHRPSIVKAILADHPEAIECLKKNNLLN